MFGIRSEYDAETAKTLPLTVWAGAFCEEFIARGFPRHGAKSATFTTPYDEKVRVVLPEGVTFPRTEKNYLAIDRAISDAFSA